MSTDPFARAAAARLAGRLLAVAAVDTEIAALLRLPGVDPVDRAIAMLERLQERAVAYGIDPAELDLPQVDAVADAEIRRLEGQRARLRLVDGPP